MDTNLILGLCKSNPQGLLILRFFNISHSDNCNLLYTSTLSGDLVELIILFIIILNKIIFSL